MNNKVKGFLVIAVAIAVIGGGLWFFSSGDNKSSPKEAAWEPAFKTVAATANRAETAALGAQKSVEDLRRDLPKMIRDALAELNQVTKTGPPDQVIASAENQIKKDLVRLTDSSVTDQDLKTILTRVAALLEKLEKCACAKQPQAVKRARAHVAKVIHHHHYYEEPSAEYLNRQQVEVYQPQQQLPYWGAAPAQPVYQQAAPDYAVPLAVLSAGAGIASAFGNRGGGGQPVNVYNQNTNTNTNTVTAVVNRPQPHVCHNCPHFNNTNPNRPLGPTPLYPGARPYSPPPARPGVVPPRATVVTTAPRAPIGMPQPPSKPSGIVLPGR